MKRILVIIVVTAFLLLFCCTPKTTATQNSYAVLLGLNPENASILASYDTAVIDAQYFTKDEIAAAQAEGTAVYTYLNIGSVETFREGYDDLKRFALAPYDNWPDEYWMDVSRPEWQAFIAHEAQQLIDKGVDGFFLDNADVYYLYPSDEIYNGLTSMILTLGAYKKPILVNGGDVFVTRAVLDTKKPLTAITGVNQECVFTGIDFVHGVLNKQDTENTQYYQEYLSRCKAAGLSVYLTEYAPKGSDIGDQIRDYCAKFGFAYYISPSINLDG